ncbi:MAG TPA: hypothetical protein VHT91_13640 [Kofleriaceae bacterium]|jgi:hypothetical protein|nr:hypothetical protein [Kofleriaceae bacterium]
MKQLLLIMVVVVATPGAVHAQSADSGPASKVTLARRLYDEGVDAVGKNQWSLAYDRFKTSYELAPRILTLYNLAGAQGQTGRLVEAGESYRKFLHDTGDGRYAEYRTEATNQLELIGRQIAQLTVEIPNLEPTDAVAIDDIEFPQAALHEAIPINPGSHTVRIRRGAAMLASRAVTLSSGGTETVHIELAVNPPDLAVHRPPDSPAVTAPAAPAPAPKPGEHGASRTWLRSPWLWSGVAVVVAGAGAGAYLVMRSPDGVRVR